jgi:hypothetical protein
MSHTTAASEIPLGPDFTKRPVGYLDDWKPYKSTQVLLARVDHILAEYRDHLPLTVRQIYYRMIGAFGYPKGKKFETKLSEALVNARRVGMIPFEHIRDDGIMSCGGFWYDGVAHYRNAEYLRAKDYRSDLQSEQDKRVQVWCEAAGMIPQLRKITDPYSIPVYSCGGFNSLTAIREIVDSCELATSTVLLHLGDYDPSGEAIFNRVEADVTAFLEEDAPYSDFTAERVCLTRAQVEEHDLVMDPITTKDTRSRKWIAEGRTEKCELEALAPDLLAKFLQKAIDSYVDADDLAESRRKELLDKAVVWVPEPKSGHSGISFDRLLHKLRNGGPS